MISFNSMTRGGLRRECLWMNYPEPTALHTNWYIGENYRERERIKRKRLRWENRLRQMPLSERQLIIEALNNLENEIQDIASPNIKVVAGIDINNDAVPETEK